MTVLQIVKMDIETLTKKSEEWNFESPPMNASELAHDLVETMYANDGLGIAAIQVGIPLRVFAMRGHPENFVFFNPRIVMPGTEQVKLDEGCLSFPGLIVEIKRPRDIKIRAAGPSGEVFTKTLTGMSARVFQHEMDHLDGLLFYNKTNKYKRTMALKKADKYIKRNKIQTPKISNIPDLGKSMTVG